MVIDLETIKLSQQPTTHNNIRYFFAYFPAECIGVGINFYRDAFQSELVLYEPFYDYSSENQEHWQRLDSVFGREAWQEFLRRFENRMISKEKAEADR